MTVRAPCRAAGYEHWEYLNGTKKGLEMKDAANLPVLPDLSNIDFSCSTDTRALVRERCEHMFGVKIDRCIEESMDAIEGLFAGHYPEYQPMDTAYHNITHTLQATLCLAELTHRRHLAEAEPRISMTDFRRAIIAALYHDIGYLKTIDDTEGTGAKYTHVHEQRSCEMAREFLALRGWPEDDLLFVEHLISATGPQADLTKIAFRSEIEQTLGQALCTADYVGQMSDPDYPDKLEILFHEFEESYQFQNLSRSQWPFGSYEDLLCSTPNFWNKFVRYKLDVECGGIWQYLEHPVTGDNTYLEAIERNLGIIDQRIAQLEQPPLPESESRLSANL
jgi:hypothetical protein